MYQTCKTQRTRRHINHWEAGSCGQAAGRQKYLPAILALFLSFSAAALPEDAHEKLLIVSDSSIYNYKTGINTFEGHVKVDQGSTHILADRLITKSNSDHKIKEAIAYGFQQTAHYWTLPKLGDPEIHANGNIITYYPIASNVIIKENVLVTQGENSFQGKVIHYNMKDQTIIVPASENGRAVLVYNPDS